MITAISPEPALSATTAVTDYRYRPAMGERTILPDSTAKAPPNAAASENGTLPKAERQSAPASEPEPKDNSTMFAAAVISGALSPKPQTMEELIARIGTSAIPEELEARLKDFLA